MCQPQYIVCALRVTGPRPVFCLMRTATTVLPASACIPHHDTRAQSIRSYFTQDDDFNWNYGLTLAASGKYREAEEALAAVQRDSYR